MVKKVHDAGVCPYCDSTHIDYGEVTPTGENAVEENNYCMDCKQHFTSFYVFSFSEEN